MSARPLKMLDREARLVAILAAVGSPLPRGEIYARVDADFDDETQCAKTLGRLVADGRLVRSKRGEEFIYEAHRGNAARVGVIASAVENVQARDIHPRPPARRMHVLEDDDAEEAQLGANGAPQLEIRPFVAPDAKGDLVTTKEEAMPKGSHGQQKTAAARPFNKYVELLENRHTWMSVAEVVGILLEHKAVIGTRLRELATLGRRYAALGVTAAASNHAAKARKGEKTEARAAGTSRHARKSVEPEEPAQPRHLPAVPSKAGRIEWAITDTGTVAIKDGDQTIKLSPADCEYGVGFLEKTQLLWRTAP
jgi:hypothetical protein